jgi:hypothetical protein
MIIFLSVLYIFCSTFAIIVLSLSFWWDEIVTCLFWTNFYSEWYLVNYEYFVTVVGDIDLLEISDFIDWRIFWYNGGLYCFLTSLMRNFLGLPPLWYCMPPCAPAFSLNSVTFKKQSTQSWTVCKRNAALDFYIWYSLILKHYFYNNFGTDFL